MSTIDTDARFVGICLPRPYISSPALRANWLLILHAKELELVRYICSDESLRLRRMQSQLFFLQTIRTHLWLAPTLRGAVRLPSPRVISFYLLAGILYRHRLLIVIPIQDVCLHPVQTYPHEPSSYPAPAYSLRAWRRGRLPHAV